MEEKKRVLIVHNRYQILGGEDTVVANEVAMLREQGHEVFEYIRSNDELKEKTGFAKLIAGVASIYSFRTKREVQKMIRDFAIDIVHVHNTLTVVSPSVFYAAFECKVPVVQTLHNFRMICPNALLYRDGHNCEECITSGLGCAVKHRCYRKSLLQTVINAAILIVHRLLGTYKKVNFICLTEFNKKKLLEAKNGRIMNEKHMFVKPNFAEYEGEIVPFDERKKQFVYVGRPERIKGIYIALDAFQKLPQYELIVCGVSNELAKCKQYVLEKDMHNVTFLGKVENQQVKEILSESLAMIMPTQLFEGFPMTIVESFACATPIIGSNIGNVGNLVQNGVNGLAFQYDDTGDLVKKIKQLEQMPDMTKTCRQIYERKYNKQSNYEQLIEIYNQI